MPHTPQPTHPFGSCRVTPEVLVRLGVWFAAMLEMEEAGWEWQNNGGSVR